MPHKKNLRAHRFLICAAILLLAQRARAQSDYDSDWTKNFRVGAMVGFNIKANFKMSGTFPVSSSKPGPTGVFGAHHVYDDGYVHPDVTGDSDLTWNWGIQNADQWDQANNQLLMHSTTSYTTSGSGSGQDNPYLGFELAYGGQIIHQDWWRVGWEFGFGWLPIKISENTVMFGTATRSTYAFDTGGSDLSQLVGNISPGNPYNGTAAGPGPEIHNNATLIGTDTQDVSISGTHTLDVNLYTFRLGPTFYADLSPRVGVQIGAGGALGLVSGDLKYDEMITVGTSGPVHSSGSIGATDLTWGGYVNAMITFHTVKNGDFYLGAQYMPMGTAHIGNSTRRADLNLTGQIYFSAGINWPF